MNGIASVIINADLHGLKSHIDQCKIVWIMLFHEMVDDLVKYAISNKESENSKNKKKMF